MRRFVDPLKIGPGHYVVLVDGVVGDALRVTLNDGVLSVWGLSYWRRSLGYRTLGISLQRYLDEHPTAKFIRSEDLSR